MSNTNNRNENHEQNTHICERICYFMLMILMMINVIISCLTNRMIAAAKSIDTDYTEFTIISETESESELTEESTESEATTLPPTELFNEEWLVLPSEKATIESETTEVVPEVDPYDVELLAMVIYQEVGGDAQCDDCRRRVADVVLNRVESDLYPDNIYDVLAQPYQYGDYWWRYGVGWAARASWSTETEAVERARRIAREVLEGNHSEVYGKNYFGQAGFEQGSEGFWHCGVYYACFD